MDTITVGELIRLLSHWSPDTPAYFNTPDNTYNIGNATDYDNYNVDGLTLFAYEG